MEGIVVSKPGINAGTVTDPNDMIFHSSYNAFKIIQSGTIGLSVVGSIGNMGTVLGTVNHNLGTPHGFYGFMYLTAADIMWPLRQQRVTSIGTTGAGVIVYLTKWYVDGYCSANDLIFSVISSSNDTAKIAYYLFDIHG